MFITSIAMCVYAEISLNNGLFFKTRVIMFIELAHAICFVLQNFR